MLGSSDSPEPEAEGNEVTDLSLPAPWEVFWWLSDRDSPDLLSQLPL